MQERNKVSRFLSFHVVKVIIFWGTVLFFRETKANFVECERASSALIYPKYRKVRVLLHSLVLFRLRQKESLESYYNVEVVLPHHCMKY